MSMPLGPAPSPKCARCKSPDQCRTFNLCVYKSMPTEQGAEDIVAARNYAQSAKDNNRQGAHSIRPDGLLAQASETFRIRNAVYGDNYKRFGRAFLALFPNDELPPIKTVGDMQRIQLMVQIMTKLTRYAENVTKGGHKDSAHDLVVYSAMLEEETTNG